jgi:AraC family transcriptional regulator
MHLSIEWKEKGIDNGFLFYETREWDGAKLRHYRVRPGALGEHCESCHNLSIPLDGRATVTKQSSNGAEGVYVSDNSNICLIPYGQPVRADWEIEVESIGIDLDPEFVRRTAAEANLAAGSELYETSGASDALLRQLGIALLAESRTDAPQGRLYAESLIQTITLHLLTHYSSARGGALYSPGGLPGYKLRRVKEFIAEHLEDDLGLTELAAAAGLSRFHFARAFRKTTGQTPQQYLTGQRIEQAKALLEKSDLPLVEVGLRTGFKNQSHFTTLFRRLTNLTPKGWRELRTV